MSEAVVTTVQAAQPAAQFPPKLMSDDLDKWGKALNDASADIGEVERDQVGPHKSMYASLSNINAVTDGPLRKNNMRFIHQEYAMKDSAYLVTKLLHTPSGQFVGTMTQIGSSCANRLNYKGDLTSITRAHKEELLSLSAETEPAVQTGVKSPVSDTVMDSAQRAMTQAKTKEAGEQVMQRVAKSVKDGRLTKDEATVLQNQFNKKFGGTK